MKKISIILLSSLTAAGLFASGWFLGQKSATKPAGALISTLMYDNAHDEVINDDMLIKSIDTGHLEEAKQSLYLRLDGSILMLNHQLEETNSEISISGMKILLRMDGDTQAEYGTREKRANLVIAGVANYRREHPWTYSGEHPVATDPLVEAKLAGIFQKAAASTK